MKMYFLILFSLLQIQALGSQIVVGLRAKNTVIWHFWENKNGHLKHYLYLYNKTQSETVIDINLKRFKSIGSVFEVEKAQKIFDKVRISAGQFKKLAYPEEKGRLDFMNFFEDGNDIGLLHFDLEKPDKSFVQDKYRYYSHAGMNGASTLFWTRFESIETEDTEIGISADFKNPNETCLIKIIDSDPIEGESYWTKLYSWQKSDPTIVELRQSNNLHTFHLRRSFGKESLLIFEIIVEYIENEKLGRANNARIPLFKKN